MLRTWVTAKLHGLTVTDASVEYHGSVSICPRLMKEAGIAVGEQVHVVNLNTGGRWVTYALEGQPGAFTLNGGGARLGEIGDRCVLMTYGLAAAMMPAPVLFLDEANRVTERSEYR